MKIIYTCVIPPTCLALEHPGTQVKCIIKHIVTHTGPPRSHQQGRGGCWSVQSLPPHTGSRSSGVRSSGLSWIITTPARSPSTPGVSSFGLLDFTLTLKFFLGFKLLLIHNFVVRATQRRNEVVHHRPELVLVLHFAGHLIVMNEHRIELLNDFFVSAFQVRE